MYKTGYRFVNDGPGGSTKSLWVESQVNGFSESLEDSDEWEEMCLPDMVRIRRNLLERWLFLPKREIETILREWISCKDDLEIGDGEWRWLQSTRVVWREVEYISGGKIDGGAVAALAPK